MELEAERLTSLNKARAEMYQVGVDHINKLLALSRTIAARGGGVDVQQIGAPYPGASYTIVNAPTQETPEKKSSILPWIAGIGLAATGLGAAGGALYAVNQTPPGKVKPADYEVKIGFEPEKGGLQVGPLEPVK